jgi:hypothetical protein
MGGPFDIFIAFGIFVVPLTVLEMYLRARKSASAPAKLAAATVLGLCAVVTAIGVFRTIAMWKPYF